MLNLVIRDPSGIVSKNCFVLKGDLDYAYFCDFLADFIDAADEVVVYLADVWSPH